MGRAMKKILIADDHESIRTALTALLELVDGVEVVGEAVNGAEAVSMAAELHPDVVIMDLRMPEMDGIEATRLIKSRFVTIRVIGHSAYASPDLSTAMTEAGADDFIIKGTLDLLYIEGLIAA